MNPTWRPRKPAPLCKCVISIPPWFMISWLWRGTTPAFSPHAPPHPTGSWGTSTPMEEDIASPTTLTPLCHRRDGIITWEVVYGRFHSSFGCWEKVVEIHISSSREFLGQVISDIILHNTNTNFCLYCLWFMCVCAYIVHAYMCAFADVHMCGLLAGKCGEMHWKHMLVFLN